MIYTINIREKALAGFDRIFNIPDRDFTSIIDGLSLSSLSSSLTKISTQVSLLKSISANLMQEIFFSVGSVMSYLEKGVKANELADGVFEALADKAAFEWVKKENKEIFIDRLAALLNSKQILYAAKGSSLKFEYQNVYLDARISTDFRPVFDIDIETGPIAGIIIHNLHLHYQNDEEAPHKDLFLALDASDIRSLKDILIRAEAKEMSLLSVIKMSGIENLNE